MNDNTNKSMSEHTPTLCTISFAAEDCQGQEQGTDPTRGQYTTGKQSEMEIKFKI